LILNILPVIVGYLLGAIPFGLIIARFYGIKDIRKTGSGNIGATNVWRVAGRVPGLIVLLCDIGKGVIAVLIASAMSQNNAYAEYIRLLSAMAAILGHIFPVYLVFRGGKGVNTALGTMVTLLPKETLMALGIFIIIVAIFKYISLASIIAAISFAAIIVIEYILELAKIHPIYIGVGIILAILIIITHRGNIKRLLSGTENRFQFRSRKNREVKNNA
jgi:glycerol-3-phosphate acyltransferase PlsY